MTTNRFFKLILPILCLAFTACSSDNDEPILPEFPEMQVVSLSAGQQTEINFKATSEWRLVSDKVWLRFLVPGTETTYSGDDNEEVAVVYGDAGEQTVTIIMKDNGHTFEPETATITMAMEGQTKAIFEVTRRAKSYEVSMVVRTGFSGSLEEADRLDMNYDTQYRLGFTANYDWKIDSYPDWIEPLSNITGKADVAVSTSNIESVYVKTDLLPYEKEGEIVIIRRSGEGNPVSFPITYDGMDSKVLTFNPPLYKNNGMMFSLDGFYCTGSGSDFDPYVKTEDKEKTFNIVTRNMDYRLLLMEYDMGSNTPREVPLDDSWLSCVESPDTKGEITVSLLSDNDDEDTRSLYLYFIPPYYYDNIGEYNFAKDFTVVDGKVNFNGRNGLGIAIRQQGVGKAATDEGFVIFKGNGDLLSEPIKVVDAEITGDYGITNIYAREFTREEWDVSYFGITVTGAEKLALVQWDVYPEWADIDYEYYGEDGYALVMPALSFDQLSDDEPASIYFFVPDAGGAGRELYGVLKIYKAFEE